MRALYLLRVVFVSVEALVLAVALLAFFNFRAEFEWLASSLSVNEEVLKYLMLMPTALAVWVINETRVLLQEDKETILILTDWSDYWRLKIHTWTSLGYAVVFAFMSLIPWAAKSGIETAGGLLLLVSSTLGQLCVAVSVYAARIMVGELIAQAKKS